MSEATPTKVRFPRQIPIRHLFHVPTLSGVIPGVVLLSAIASASGLALSLLVVWLAVHALTLLVAGLLGWAFVAILRAGGRSRVGPLIVLTTGALVGGAKGFFTALVDLSLGLTDAAASELFIRGLGGIVVGVWLIGTIAYARSALEQLEDARGTLVRANIARRLTEEAASTPPELTTSLYAVRGLRDQLTHDPQSTTAKEIRSVVDATIRPLSRALWSIEQQRYPSLRLSSLYRVALGSMRPRGWLIGVVWSATSLTGLAVPLGIIDALLYVGWAGLLGAALFSLIRLPSRLPIAVSLPLLIVSSITAVFGGNALARLVYPPFSDLMGPGLLVSGVAWMTFVAISASMLSGVLDIRRVIEADLASHDTQALIDTRAGLSAEAVSARRLATELHGRVQSKLLAVASAFDQRRLNREQLAQQLGDVVGNLEKLAGINHTDGDTDAQTETLRSLEEAWAGLVDLRIDDTSRSVLDLALVSRPELMEPLREVINNAHRHGHAGVVEVSARSSEDALEIVITDDGYGPTGGGAGLGSALFDLWTQGNWSLGAAADGGSRVTMVIDQNRLAPSQHI
ncbi:hypothetical protein [Pontimonas sp.]|uniref:hypothetical protein n=1 Tax=Pontimonas sp. TaxID=2304492 RepID=UPI0028702ACA|nr:hypothetical protein [Pontimonas sp.]MDR9397355.1 hypothetical protein [Pontimonas sp.]